MVKAVYTAIVVLEATALVNNAVTTANTVAEAVVAADSTTAYNTEATKSPVTAHRYTTVPSHITIAAAATVSADTNSHASVAAAIAVSAETNYFIHD